MITKKIIGSLFLSLAFLSSAYAEDDIPISINELFAQDEYRNLNVGMLVINADTGTTVYEKNSDRYFMPASNQKLFTAFAALQYLTPRYQYHTYIFADLSKVQDGVLDDNIYFKFTGDPTFTFSQLDDLINQLAKANVTKINGDIIIDDSAFDDEVMSPGTTWDDLQYCFGSPMSAVIINRNCMYPKLMQDMDIKIAVKDPRENLKMILYSLLASHHIIFYKKIQFTTINQPVKYLASVSSSPMSELVKIMLKESDNTIANALFKTMGSLSAQQAGSWKNGQEAEQALIRRATSLELPSRSLFDGAGGSRYNFLTPRQIVTLLQKVRQMPFAEVYINALPISGIDGTLKDRFQAPELRGKILAKTGTMSGATSLSGYMVTQHHHTLIFSIIINNFTVPTSEIKHLEDELCEAIVKY